MGTDGGCGRVGIQLRGLAERCILALPSGSGTKMKKLCCTAKFDPGYAIYDNIIIYGSGIVSYPDPNVRKHYRLQYINDIGSGKQPNKSRSGHLQKKAYNQNAEHP